MLKEMWTSSSSDAVVEPGNSRSELTQSWGNWVLLQAREIAWVGFPRILGPFWTKARFRPPITITAEMAEATIKTMARTDNKMSFFLLEAVADNAEDFGLEMMGASERLDEPPGSEGPILPNSILL